MKYENLFELITEMNAKKQSLDNFNKKLTIEELRTMVDTEKMVDALENAENDSFLIFRLPKNHPLIFVPMEEMSERLFLPAFVDENGIYVGKLSDLNVEKTDTYNHDVLDEILHVFSWNPPKNYQGPFIAYGDVVVLKLDNDYSSFMVICEELGYENYPQLLD